MAEKKRPVSPRNGQPLPRGRPFTSETAREAARKSNHIQAERKSIAESFKRQMTTMHTITDKRTGKTVEMTGAEIIANSIVTACNKGNANAMNIALALMGEKPAEKLAVTAGNFDALNEAFAALKGDDIE